MVFSGNGLIKNNYSKNQGKRKLQKKICYLKPMRLEIRKKQAENTVLRIKKLKLVVPCQNEKGKENLFTKKC
ncbi:MAG: hypothetical protein Ct9H90mP2_13950 [Dehalococcoidia bacterium]|nr:MAG: hypothetical protein Ct9H90mP2_13950 [Dehalococcoidia bacterium]